MTYMHASMYCVRMYVCTHMGRDRFACVEPRHAHTRSLHWMTRIECLCTTAETPLFCPGTRCFSPLVTMCTPLPCAQGRLTVDAILLSAKPLPSFSFVSDISCRGQHLNGCSSAIKRCALACLAFESHGWLSVAHRAGSTRFWSRQTLGPAAVCPDRCAHVRIRDRGGWPAHTATA